MSTVDSEKNGAAPSAFMVGDTTKALKRETANTLKAMGKSHEDVIDALIDRMLEKTGSGDGGGGGKRFLGMDAGEWVKKVIGVLVLGAAAVFTWYQAVNKGLEDRPTTNEVNNQIVEIDKSVDEKLEKVGDRIGKVETKQAQIRESQIRTEEQSKAQTEQLNQILREIRITRRR